MIIYRQHIRRQRPVQGQQLQVWQVRATVRASIPSRSDIHAGQRSSSKGSGDADMFLCILSLARRRLLPLRGTGNGYLAAAGLLLVLGPGQVAHAAVRQASAYAIVVVVAAVAVLVAVRLLRQMLVRRQLSRRVTYDLLPSTSFDPSPEDVARFAHQLARTRPVVAWLRPRRGASIRIRLYTDAEGRLCYQVSGPASAGSVLRHQSYAQVELRDATAAAADGHLSAEDGSPRADS
jgi:hypothetical protein